MTTDSSGAGTPDEGRVIRVGRTEDGGIGLVAAW
jgi:hypothetical protein